MLPPGNFWVLPRDTLLYIYGFLRGNTKKLRVTCKYFQTLDYHPFLKTIPQILLDLGNDNIIHKVGCHEDTFYFFLNRTVLALNDSGRREVDMPEKTYLCTLLLFSSYVFGFTPFNLFYFDLKENKVESQKGVVIYSNINDKGFIAISDKSKVYLCNKGLKKVAQFSINPNYDVVRLALEVDKLIISQSCSFFPNKVTVINFEGTQILETIIDVTPHDHFFYHRQFLIMIKYSKDRQKLSIVSFNDAGQKHCTLNIPFGYSNVCVKKWLKKDNDYFLVLETHSIVKIHIKEDGNMHFVSHIRDIPNHISIGDICIHDNFLIILSSMANTEGIFSCIEFWSTWGDFRGRIRSNKRFDPARSFWFDGQVLTVCFTNLVKQWKGSSSPT